MARTRLCLPRWPIDHGPISLAYPLLCGTPGDIRVCRHLELVDQNLDQIAKNSGTTKMRPFVPLRGGRFLATKTTREEGDEQTISAMDAAGQGEFLRDGETGVANQVIDNWWPGAHSVP